MERKSTSPSYDRAASRDESPVKDKLSIEDLAKLLRAYDINTEFDDTRMLFAGEQLHGAAQTWYQAVRDLDEIWAVFKARFIRHFDSSSVRRDLRVSLQSDPQKKDEPAVNFIATKYRLWKRLVASDERDYVDSTIGLLQPDYDAF